jgi:hypothetical protein
MKMGEYIERECVSADVSADRGHVKIAATSCAERVGFTRVHRHVKTPGYLSTEGRRRFQGSHWRPEGREAEELV